MSELLPFQKNSTLPSRVLSWIQSVEPKATPLPVVILQECLIVYIKKQVSSSNASTDSLCVKYAVCIKNFCFYIS